MAVADRTPGRTFGSRVQRAYVTEFDVLRGVAIVFVVYMHAWFGPWDGVPHHELLITDVLLLLGHSAVPVDFFMSAYLLGRDTSPSLGNFVRRKLRRIGIPVAFGTLLIVAYRVWQAGGIDPTLLRDIALFNVTGPYYYVLVLVMFMVGAWLIRGWSTRNLGILAAASFVISLATIVYYQQSTLSGDFLMYAYRNPGVWLFYGAFGYYASRRWQSLEWTRRALLPALAAMAIVTAAYFIQGEIFHFYPAGVFGVTVFLFNCSALIVYPALVSIVAQDRIGQFVLFPFRWLARFAFAIYLLHMPFFTGYLTNITVSNSAFGRDYLLLVGAIFVVGFGACVAVIALLDRVAAPVAGLLLGTEPQKRGQAWAMLRVGRVAQPAAASPLPARRPNPAPNP